MLYSWFLLSALIFFYPFLSLTDIFAWQNLAPCISVCYLFETQVEEHLTTYFLNKYLFALKDVYIVYISKKWFFLKILFFEKGVFF